MIWGYRRLNFYEIDWMREWRYERKMWPYLCVEFEVWDYYYEAKRLGVHDNDFQRLKNAITPQYHYIFTNYFSLYEYYYQLESDLEKISKLDVALDIALWIYRNPSWEIGKMANIILLHRLRSRNTRNEAIAWFENIWAKEELYALDEVLFQLPVFLDSHELFYKLCLSISRAKNCQIRGSFLSNLCIYVENTEDFQFIQFVKNEVIPEMLQVSEDIWETQELIRLVNIIREYLSDQEVQEYVNSHKILSVIDNPFQMDYNDFWRIAERKYLNV
jgi:hypothetical protein